MKLAKFSGPCYIAKSKNFSKNTDLFHECHHLQSADVDLDILYFKVITDNQEFCGQAAIPLSSLRPGEFYCFIKQTQCNMYSFRHSFCTVI